MKIRALALALLLAVLPLAVGAQEEAADPPPAGPTVTAIEIRSEADPGAEMLEDLEGLLGFEVGEPLTEESIRGTLRNLQASGAAASTEIYTLPGVEGGVEVIVVLRPAIQVREVRVEGDLGLPVEELRRVLPQKEAAPLGEEAVLQGVYNLLDLYEENGYFAAQARVRVETDEASLDAAVIYDVASGARARVQSVRFEGDLGPFQPAALAARLEETGPGKTFSRPEARQDGERLERWLILEQGHRRARVQAPSYEIDGDEVRLTYAVEVGPKVEVEVIGADIDKLRRRDLLPFLGRGGYDEALVLQSVDRIERYYQQEGHYKVRVEREEQESEDLLRLVLRIEPGPQYTLQQIGFTGNPTFGGEQLGELMQTSARSLLALGSGRLVEDVLEEDLKNIRRFYQLQGFTQVEVGPADIEERGTDLFLTIPIVEGPRLRVVSLDLEGIESLSGDTVRANLRLTEGGPFHPYLLEQSLNGLRAAYRDLGYSEAQVSAREDWNPDRTLVDVTIQALEGQQTLLDRVIVRGNRRTESGVIDRTLAIDRGDPISERRALEIERDLYRLGVFSSVDVEVTRAGLESATRDLIVRVEEGRPRRVSYGLGIEYSGDESEQGKWNPRGTFSFSHNNVAGRAYTLRTDLRVSPQDKIFRLTFDQPYSFRWAVPVSYSLFYFNEDKDDWDVVRYGFRTEAERVFADRRVNLAYDYRIVEPDPEPDLPTVEERDDRDYRLSSLIPTFFWDRRDDPVLTTRGWSSLAQLQYAFPFLETDGNFLKLFVQQTQYLDLRRSGTVAASLRVGGIEPFQTLVEEDIELPETLPSANVFIAERFFAGGGTTHRAYGRDDLGIPGRTLILRPGETDDYAAVGGNGLLLFNLEYRFPLFGPVGGTVFYDAGNVWADWRDIDLGEVKSGLGVGLRYLSPIGPIRGDIGWKLDREPFEEDAFSFSLSFGNPF